MALHDRDTPADLTAEFLQGSAPFGVEGALSVLALLAGGGGNAGNDDAGSTPPLRATAAEAWWPAGAPDPRELRLAEARYRALVEQIPAVVFRASVEGRLNDIYVSPQIEALLGFTQKEWAGNPVLWFRQLHPEDRVQLSREFAKTCITGQPFRGIVRVFSRAGTLVWVHAEARLVRDESGHPLFLHGVAFDITEQQQAQQTRQQLLSEHEARLEADRERERLREMFTNLPSAIAVLHGPSHTIEFLNPVALELAGAGSEMTGRTWQEAFPGFPEETAAVFDRVFSTGEPFSAREWRALRREHERFFSFVCQPLRDRQGAVTGLLTHMVEVTEQRQAQAAAEEASRRASFLASVSHALSANLDYESIPDAVAGLVVPELADLSALALVHSDGSVRTLALVHRDPAQLEVAKRLWDRCPLALDAGGIDRVVRSGLPELVSEVDDGFLAAAARDPEHLALLRQLAPEAFITVPIRGRGLVHGVLTLVTAASGRRYGPQDVVIAEDVAQRAALAIDNAQLYREAQQASRLKDEFLATLSHELRTPLNAIVGWSHILRTSAAESSPDVRKAVEIIARNAHAQNQIISDILDVSSIIAGKLVFKVQLVDLASVIEAALDTVRLAAQAKEILLQPILDPSAGPVSGDPDRLQQVIWNLLSNAIKFSPQQGRVQIRLEASGSEVEVAVEDSGPGIDPDFLPFVFERFRQADSSSSRRHGGLGLGLAIVRHLVELHGGSVEAANRADRSGAVLKLRLPRRRVASGATRLFDHDAAAEATMRLERAPSLAGLRVLVVDDEPDARELVAAVLERCGAQATAAASSGEAYAALQRARFDVLLADIEMPEEDGYSLMRRIRRLSPGQGGAIPAAALTAYASTQDRVRSLEAGFQAHLAKPVRPAELAAAVANLARREET